MKFGLIDFNLTVKSYWENSWNHKALLNVGDAVEYRVIEQIYRSLEINEKDIIRISISELKSYRGSKIIMPLNIALDSYIGYNSILDELSPDIIPVFLGMSFADVDLTPRQQECLLLFAPIGCRDERSYLLMKSLGIPCYLNGCLASALSATGGYEEKYYDKIVFIDVPRNVYKFIPDSIKKDIVFFSQELYCTSSSFGMNNSPFEWANNILKMYSSKPKLIVTSRFHGAVLALANDIPAIITLEKYTFRFSWLNNYYPIFTEDNYDKIDWGFVKKRLDYSTNRELLLRIAKARIMDSAFWNSDVDKITQMQMNKTKQRESSASNQTLYYEEVWKEIKAKWDPSCEYKYGFWGINDNTEKLFALISEYYPNAKLVSIYDMYKETSFNGIVSTKPAGLKEYKNDKSFFVIVTAYLASRVAVDVFDLCGFPFEQSFLCNRQFVDESCLYDS